MFSLKEEFLAHCILWNMVHFVEVCFQGRNISQSISPKEIHLLPVSADFLLYLGILSSWRQRLYVLSKRWTVSPRHLYGYCWIRVIHFVVWFTCIETSLWRQLSVTCHRCQMKWRWPLWSIGQGEAPHRKYKRLKLGGGHVYDCSSV
jgi:hypothetical protein